MTEIDGRPDQLHARTTRRWSTLIGLVVGLAGVAFVVRALVRNWDEVSAALDGARPTLLLLALGLGGLAMMGIGVAWHTSLRLLGSGLPILSALRGYFVGQLGKYVPGGIWAIMGRGEWARSAGVRGAVAYTSVMLSMGSAYLAALVLVAVLVPLSGLFDSGADVRFALVLLLLPLGFLLIHPKVFGFIIKTFGRVGARPDAIVVPTWGASTAVVLQQVPSWLLIGGVSLTISAALGDTGDAVNIISATAIAWIVGFLVLPTPGGIGVREAA
ncbi:MAG: lysylphosphatidylglycerol synthase domain-containing protein, partial [Acidimicrobiia bacterium]|nr:lysylphosphatidylglycerol synthase domain-containing protein [Acidimicrobiia bacterium]